MFLILEKKPRRLIASGGVQSAVAALGGGGDRATLDWRHVDIHSAMASIRWRNRLNGYWLSRERNFDLALLQQMLPSMLGKQG
jgi:hypothetical protein